MYKHGNAGWNKMAAKDRQQLVAGLKLKVTELRTAGQFLARLHFSAEELLLYPRRPRQCRHPHAKC